MEKFYNALVFQIVTQGLYEDKIKAHLAVASRPSGYIQTANLSHEEKVHSSAAWYVVPFMLLRKCGNLLIKKLDILLLLRIILVRYWLFILVL